MIINVYKPKDWTSNDVVQKIKHTCGFKKVGHAGTLDPLAEGVLLVLTDADTKKQNDFMALRKEYLVKLVFGYESDSHDLGTPLRPLGVSSLDKLTRDTLESVLAKYIGKISQQVPAYSAVHVNGQRLYKVARANALGDMALPYKEVEIDNIIICAFRTSEQLKYSEIKDEPIICTTAELRVTCSKGTYVRSLARDLGKDLECGAVAIALTRTKVGDYSVDDSLDLEGFLKNYRNQIPTALSGQKSSGKN